MLNFMQYLQTVYDTEDIKDIIQDADDYLKKVVYVKDKNSHAPRYSFHALPPITDTDAHPSEDAEEYRQRWGTVVKKFRQQNEKHGKDAKAERLKQNQNTEDQPTQNDTPQTNDIS